jgi:hypothetical protein
MTNSSTQRRRSSAAPLPPFDERLRYRIPVTAAYLDQSVSKTWADIASGELRAIREGGRTFVPGSEIARRCAAPSA